MREQEHKPHEDIIGQRCVAIAYVSKASKTIRSLGLGKYGGMMEPPPGDCIIQGVDVGKLNENQPEDQRVKMPCILLDTGEIAWPCNAKPFPVSFLEHLKANHPDVKVVTTTLAEEKKIVDINPNGGGSGDSGIRPN